MANEEQLALLKQGVDVWNAWRQRNPDVAPDLRAVDLINVNLRKVDLQEANLYSTIFQSVDLREAILINANLQGANLRGANLREANLRRANLVGADLTEAILYKTNLHQANLHGANLSRTNLKWAKFYKADLSQTGLSNSDLRGTDLSNATLRKANLIGASLIGTFLSHADLSGADLRGLTLYDVKLEQTILTEATLSDSILAKLDLSLCQGLETIHHIGPSTIGTDTFYLSQGKIPEAFLRGCGIPDALIEQIPSLIGAQRPIEFYSCFISYSSKDDAFARRLHERMRAEHLRVWFAPEDAKGGDKLYDQLDRAIQLHDRLLLVLSEESIRSEWVMTEIRRARKAEVKEGCRKLFPIRLIPYEALEAWTCIDTATGSDLAEEIRSYYIPDFSNWKEHDAFEAAFAKLLRDLRAAEQTGEDRGIAPIPPLPPP